MILRSITEAIVQKQSLQWKFAVVRLGIGGSSSSCAASPHVPADLTLAELWELILGPNQSLNVPLLGPTPQGCWANTAWKIASPGSVPHSYGGSAMPFLIWRPAANAPSPAARSASSGSVCPLDAFYRLHACRQNPAQATARPDNAGSTCVWTSGGSFRSDGNDMPSVFLEARARPRGDRPVPNKQQRERVRHWPLPLQSRRSKGLCRLARGRTRRPQPLPMHTMSDSNLRRSMCTLRSEVRIIGSSAPVMSSPSSVVFCRKVTS